MKLTTPRLLAYRDAMLSLEQSARLSDWSESELSRLDPEKLYFKEDPRWQRAYADLLGVLSEREHVGG